MDAKLNLLGLKRPPRHSIDAAHRLRCGIDGSTGSCSHSRLQRR